MAYTIEDVNQCTKKIVFNFENLDLTKEIQNALKEKQKTVNLKGFRKGKAPLSMVEKFYGPEVESNALNRFVQNEFFTAIESENLKVVGQPSFEELDYKSGEKVSFNALVEIFPDFELAPYDSLSFERETVSVEDAEIEASRKRYLESKAELREVEAQDAALEKGQMAIFNFEGEKADGSRPDNMKGEDYQLEIGSGQFIPGFEDNMIGLKKGEKKTIELTFPEDYHVEELKSAPVKFYVELLEIKEKKYPEFNDELAKEFGFDSVSDFETKTRDNLLKQKERQADEKLNQQILEKLVDLNKFEVPKAMLTQQEEYLIQDLYKNLQSQGFTEEMAKEYFSKWREDITTKAQFQVRSGLILDKLAKKFNIESTEADLEAKIEETAQATNLPAEQIRQYYLSNEQMKKNMLYAAREEKTFKKLWEELKIS